MWFDDARADMPRRKNSNRDQRKKAAAWLRS
jgi:hypothetical protein